MRSPAESEGSRRAVVDSGGQIAAVEEAVKGTRGERLSLTGAPFRPVTASGALLPLDPGGQGSTWWSGQWMCFTRSYFRQAACPSEEGVVRAAAVASGVDSSSTLARPFQAW